MRHNIKQRLSALWLILSIFAVSGCSALIDKYDPIAYQNATSIKVESLALMDKATSPYSENEAGVEDIKLKIDKAFEYANGRPKNEIVTEQWKIMNDPSGNLLGGFLIRWKDKGKLSEVFITEAKTNVSLGFDQIIGLESGKIKPEGSN